MTWRAVRRLFEATGLVLVLVLFVVLAFADNSFVHYQSKLEAWPPRSDFAPAKPWAPDDPGKIRILAIDRSAMHGLVSPEILKHIDEATGRPIAESFDFVAGTSTGGIIGSLLLIQGDDGKPKHAVDDIRRIYLEVSRRIAPEIAGK